MSRFTRSEIGIIAESRRMNLKTLMYQRPRKWSSATIPKEIITMSTNRNLESRFSSRSSLPTLVGVDFEFISERVSFPVYKTIATICPVEARTVFCHKVFSRPRGSFYA